MSRIKSGKLNGDIRELIFYRSAKGDAKIEVLLRNENLWLTQKKIAELFDVNIPAISKHLANIYEEGELIREATVSKMETIQQEGERSVTREVDYFNLDAIIAVGYRVNSKKATHFRIWATKLLKEYLIKGFVMDDERLKNPEYTFGQDYFEEQLNRIRDIRSSERRLYQKVTDIYAECSADYLLDSEITRDFYAAVQNKLHYAITRETASEIIYHRADSEKEHMGLTAWKNMPKGHIRKEDVVIAKNYLSADELDMLNRLVAMYLDYAELQARNRKVMYMKDWAEKLNSFLHFNEMELLNGKGHVTAETAKA
jgi:hypothetical protein